MHSVVFWQVDWSGNQHPNFTQLKYKNDSDGEKMI